MNGIDQEKLGVPRRGRALVFETQSLHVRSHVDGQAMAIIGRWR